MVNHEEEAFNPDFSWVERTEVQHPPPLLSPEMPPVPCHTPLGLRERQGLGNLGWVCQVPSWKSSGLRLGRKLLPPGTSRPLQLSFLPCSAGYSRSPCPWPCRASAVKAPAILCGWPGPCQRCDQFWPPADLMDDPNAIPEKTLCSQAQEPGSSSVSYWRERGYYTLETERADLLRGLFLNQKGLVSIWMCIRK